MSYKYLFDYIASQKSKAIENIYSTHYHNSPCEIFEWDEYGFFQDYQEYNEHGVLLTQIVRQHFTQNPHKFKLFKWWACGHTDGGPRSGQLKSLKEINILGEIDGSSCEWYRNGQVRSFSNYQNDQLVGEYDEWWENGHVKQIEYFNVGKITGICQYNNEDGTLNHKRLYYENQLLTQW